MEKIHSVKVGIVGCGMISRIYINNLKNLFQITEVAALCNRTRSKAEEKAKIFGIDRVLTLEEMLHDPEIEVIVNLTGVDSHYDVLKAALLAGKHAYTEKMLCDTFEHGQELTSIAVERGLRLCAAPDTILGAGIQTARKMIDAGMIGRVTSVLVSNNRNQPLASEFYPFLRNPGGGFAYDVGIYSIAAMLSIMGPVRNVCGFSQSLEGKHNGRVFHMGNYGKSWKIADRCMQTASALFESGAMASIHFNGESCNASSSFMAFYGTEGILTLDDPNNFDCKVTLTRKEEGSCEIPFTHGYKGYPTPGIEGTFDPSDGHRGVGVAELCWAIRNNRPHRCSMDMALHALELLKGIDVSSDTGCVYQLRTSFKRPEPLPSGYTATEFDGHKCSDSEASLLF